MTGEIVLDVDEDGAVRDGDRLDHVVEHDRLGVHLVGPAYFVFTPDALRWKRSG